MSPPMAGLTARRVPLSEVVERVAPLCVLGSVERRAITGVVFDHREVRPGSLFCCIAGQRHDGHLFAAAAREAGAVAFVCEHSPGGAAGDGAQLVVGLATGMIFSRRTGPLGGAGILSVVLALTVMYSGAPFAVAVTGIFAYRVFALWLPMPFALASLPTLREIGQNREPEAEGVAETSEGEPALEERRAG